MAKKDNTGSKQINTVAEAAGKINIVMKENPEFTIGKEAISQKAFEKLIEDLTESHTTFLDKDAVRTSAKNDRQTKMRELRKLITRARSGIRSSFGSDSTEYQLSGCKRDSDRKKPARKNGNGNGNGGTN